MLKVNRKITDEQLAELGKNSSRQIVADRLGGRTPIDLNDVVRLAEALDVDPLILQATAGELMTWCDEHPIEVRPDRPKLPPTPRKRTPARKK
jgi:hypothetical protein